MDEARAIDRQESGSHDNHDSTKRHGSYRERKDSDKAGSRRSSSQDKEKIKRQSSSKRSGKGKKKELKKHKSLDRSSSTTSQEDPIELLTPRENGYVEEADGGEAEEEKGKRNASIKGMWKKAFKSLKSNDKQNWLSKKGSLIRRKDSEEKEEHGESSKEIDPVYSLLKCAADLPKVPAKSQKDSQGSGGAHHGGRGDSSGSTSKASSPSSSGIGPQFPSSPSHSSLPGSYSGGNGGSGGGGGGYGDGNSRNNAGGGGSGGGGSGSGGSGGTSSTLGNGAVFTSKSSRDREHMHHIVDESLGSEFRTFYKLTSPVKKTFIPSFESSSAKKSSPAPNFEGVVKRQTSYDAA